MCKKMLRICSMLLVIVMVVNLLPMSVFAEQYAESQTAEEISTEMPEDVRVVEEVTENRTEYSKEFRLSNGLSIAAVYAEAVHYEEDGQWKEIDNTLRAQTDGTYANTEGVWDVRFPQQLSKDSAISITKDTYTLSFFMAGELRQQGNLEIASVEVDAEDAASFSSGNAALLTATENAQPTGEMIPVTTAEETIPESTAEETVPETTAEETTAPTLDETIPVLNVETFSVNVNGAAETFAVQSVQTASGQVQMIDNSEAIAEVEYPEMVLDKTASQLLYADAYENTNIQYDLRSNQVKESIILEAYDSSLRGYRYTLNVGDLVPVLNEDGSIDFYDAQQESIVMLMPAPYMVDANDAYNHDIQVSLTGSGSTYTLTYILPTSWLASNERAWPVVLDPVVSANSSVFNIKDRTIASNGTFSYAGYFLECGYGPNDHIERFYIKFESLPTLTSADVVVAAQIQLLKPETSSNGTITVEVHKVPETWESETVSWSTDSENYNPTVEDYARVFDPGYYTWDVTDIVRGWYEGENTGMMFKADDATEAAGGNSWKRFYSSDIGVDGQKPVLTIAFRNNNGLESYWDYTASSAGRAGTGYVNSYTGNMVWVRDDIGFGGNRMPVSISHVYNLNDSANNDFGMGYGWRTSFNQRVYQWSEDSDYYVWEDADGTDHYFYYDSSSTYKDEDGLDLTLKTDGSGTKKYSITDKYGNISYFDTNGRLTYQQNNQATKSSISIAYTTTDGLLIDKITDGAGRVYDFTYSSSLLSKIDYLGSGSSAISTVSFTYSSNRLTKVTDPDSKVSTYTYSGKILLTAADVDGYKLTYTYYTPSETYQPYRVKSITESDGTATGGKLNIEYAHNQTTFTDHNGNVEIMQFNNFGNTISIQDDEGRAQFAQYAINDPEESGKANQLKLSSKLQNTVGNILENSSFENGNAWTVGTTFKGSNSISTNACYHGKKSLYVYARTAGTMVSNSFTIAAGATYTFSAYVKVNTSGTARLGIQNTSNNRITYSNDLNAGSGWTRLEVSYTNTSASSITACAVLGADAATYVYMDCVQVEKAATASRYNLVENGDFRYSTATLLLPGPVWNKNTGRTTLSPAAAPALSNNVYMITGSTTAKGRVVQIVPVSGNTGDSFVLSGWAKGDSAPLKDNRQFAIIGTFNYTDGTTGEFIAQFNPDTDSSVNWQYSAKAMVAEKEYSSIQVELAYDYNVNTVYFDGIQLFKEEFGNSYTYDSNGNVTSVKDLQGETTTYEYTNNNLTKEILPTGAALTYTYDDYHNVKTATTTEGLVYNFEYDTYGNNTSVSIVSGSTKITSTAAYSNSGNTLSSTTDALGNKTTYGYNANTNVLEWVQYPEDTESTRTEYTYDSMYRLATAEATTDTGSALTASYTYTDDMLTAIETGSTTYNFAYGTFALRSNVKIGTRTLATYSYTSDGNNYLDTLAYGNGDSVQYTYDDKGRVTKQTYEDGDTVTYTYDNSGALATVKDSATGRTTTYYYDFTDRLMKYVESGSNYSHSVAYTYDDINNLTALVETIDGVEHTTSYAYDDDNRITSVTNGSATKSYTYDAYGRTSTQTTKNGSSTVKTDTFTFNNPTTATTSGQIASHTMQTASVNQTLSYTYDSNGNIRTVANDMFTITYTYDSANQLIREDNPCRSLTQTWEYDDAGNIVNRKEYAYTTGELGEPTATYPYTYTDSEWGDLLTSYNGTAITYDAIGNMLSDGTRTYTWQHGRQLATLTKDSITWTYTYDTNGMRTSRSSGTTTYEYVYNGDKLTQMTIRDETAGTEKVVYIAYDAAGVPMTLAYDGEVYYYGVNIQGDVLGFTDSSGTALIRYHYDAYGKIKYKAYDAEKGALLVKINPLLYRGYVYDQETELYYLQSRYYRPEWGRFINADAFAATGQGILGNNMFAYCNNNPIMNADPNGLCTYTGYAPWISPTVTYLDCGRGDCPTSTNFQPITISVGVSGSVSIGPLSIGLQAGIATDSFGNSEIQFTFFVPISTSTPDVPNMLENTNPLDGFGVSVMGNITVTNAYDVTKLHDMGYQLGATYRRVAVDYNIIPDTDRGTVYQGITLSGGYALSDFHVTMSNTFAYFPVSFNLFNCLISVSDSVMWGINS